MKDELKAAAWTALFVFIALFGMSLVGWLGDVANWASSQTPVDFPSVSVLGKALIAAAAAAASGFVNLVVRLAQARGFLPGNGPKYGV